ncbi:MAG: AMIN domain-containing protein [Armatimonadia bacterium]|nr:AMIN domain-containing protein [Armatimonadia bacterium]
MSRNAFAAIIALVVLTAAAGLAADTCTVVVNGRALDRGEAFCDAGGSLLISADALNSALALTLEEGAEGVPWTVRGFGRSVLVRPGVESFAVGERTLKADTCPEVRDERIFVPLAMLMGTFDLRGTVQRDNGASIWAISSPGAIVTDVREGRHGDRLRIVIDLDNPAGVAWWTQPGMVALEIPEPEDAGAWTRSVRLLGIDDELGDEIRQGPTSSGNTRVEILHSSPEPPEVFTLADPPRVVVDLQRAPDDIVPEPEPGPTPIPTPPEPVTPLPTSAGVLETRNFCTPRGPVRVHVIDVDPTSSAVDVRPSLAATTVHERASVTRIVQRTGAWGGVNGGFFARSGPPLGMLVIDGEWVRDPWGGRTVLGMTADGKLLMERLNFDGRVIFSGHGAQPLSALNRGHEEQHTLVMFTRRWGRFVEGAKGRTRLAVDASGAVIEKATDGKAVSVPEAGFVLSGIGKMARSLDLIDVGCAVTPELRTTPHWPTVTHAIGGGPRLVKDGREHVTASPEGFRPDIYAGAPSRTAVGITARGRLLLVVAEGAGGDDRCGMTLKELAATMIKLGAVDAMNLDGGGSSTFVADGQLYNAPSDGVQRRVSNALLVFVSEAARAQAGED